MMTGLIAKEAAPTESEVSKYTWPSAQPDIRVLLAESLDKLEIEVVCKCVAEVVGNGGEQRALSVQGRLVFDVTSGKGDDGSMRLSVEAAGQTVILGKDSKVELCQVGESCGGDERTFKVRGVDYGWSVCVQLVTQADATTATLALVNILPLEQYLVGVIGNEMPLGWPDAALQAQAIASRTYTLSQLRPKSALFDVTSTTASQVYGGVDRQQRAKEVVQSTRGQVLSYMGEPVKAFFHSTCGGDTAPSGWAFRGGSELDNAGYGGDMPAQLSLCRTKIQFMLFITYFT